VSIRVSSVAKNVFESLYPAPAIHHLRGKTDYFPSDP
jgi:hypothetical protein